MAALTATERASVRRNLGYPDIGRMQVVDIESAMDLLSSEGCVEARAILASLVAVSTASASAAANSVYAEIEDIKFRDSDSSVITDRERVRLRRELATLLGVADMTRTASTGGSMLRG